MRAMLTRRGLLIGAAAAAAYPAASEILPFHLAGPDKIALLFEEYDPNKPDMLVLHGGMEDNPVQRLRSVTEVGATAGYNVFIYKYDYLNPFNESLVADLIKEVKRIKNIYNIKKKITVVAYSYGSIIFRGAVLSKQAQSNEGNLFQGVSLIQMATVAGGVSRWLPNVTRAKYDPVYWQYRYDINHIRALDPYKDIQNELYSPKKDDEFYAVVGPWKNILSDPDIVGVSQSKDPKVLANYLRGIGYDRPLVETYIFHGVHHNQLIDNGDVKILLTQLLLKERDPAMLAMVAEITKPLEWTDMRPLILKASARKINPKELAKALLEKGLISPVMADSMPMLSQIEAYSSKDKLYGLQNGSIGIGDKVVYNWFKGLKFGMDKIDQEKTANTLARMEPASLEQLYFMGVLTQEESSILSKYEMNVERRLRNLKKLPNEGKDLMERIKGVIKNYRLELSAKNTQQMMRRLVPLSAIHILSDYYGIAKYDMMKIVASRPNFSVWVPEYQVLVNEIMPEVGGKNNAWEIVTRYGQESREWIDGTKPKVIEYEKAHPGKSPGAIWGLFIKSKIKEQGPDEAMASKGGIDFNASKMDLQLQNAGQEIKFHIDPAQLQELQNAPGFVPVIINIQPMTDLSAFLGL